MNKSKATSDQQRIDVNQNADLERWTKEFGISRDELLKIIEIAGSKVADVADYLDKAGSPGNTA